MAGGDLRAFLESGCSLVVGALDADGEPFATRAWDLEVLDDGGEHIALLLGDGDTAALPLRHGTGRLAVTAADVRTLRSVQLKGRVTAVAPPTEADRRRLASFCDRFFGAVEEVDGTERAVLDRLAPVDVVRCTVAVEERWDQSPGPTAGTALAT